MSEPELPCFDGGEPIDKSDWPDGPWKSEPDCKIWIDDATGLICVISRNGFGALCGYVGIKQGHPLYDFSCYWDGFTPEEVLNGSAIKQAAYRLQLSNIRVHGNITFSERAIANNEPQYFFGFDCSHAGDLNPRPGCGYPAIGEIYRTIEYVSEQTTSLAKQLAAIRPIEEPTT